MKYEGWELHNFDSANLYRAYQFSLIEKQIKGNILEVGPGNCIYVNKYMKVNIFLAIERKDKTNCHTPVFWSRFPSFILNDPSIKIGFCKLTLNTPFFVLNK